MRLGLQGFAGQAEELSCILRTPGAGGKRKMLPDARRKVNWRGQEVPEPREDRVRMGERSTTRLKVLARLWTGLP